MVIFKRFIRFEGHPPGWMGRSVEELFPSIFCSSEKITMSMKVHWELFNFNNRRPSDTKPSTLPQMSRVTSKDSSSSFSSSFQPKLEKHHLHQVNNKMSLSLLSFFFCGPCALLWDFTRGLRNILLRCWPNIKRHLLRCCWWVHNNDKLVMHLPLDHSTHWTTLPLFFFSPS